MSSERSAGSSAAAASSAAVASPRRPPVAAAAPPADRAPPPPAAPRAPAALGVAVPPSLGRPGRWASAEWTPHVLRHPPLTPFGPPSGHWPGMSENVGEILGLDLSPPRHPYLEMVRAPSLQDGSEIPPPAPGAALPSLKTEHQPFQPSPPFQPTVLSQMQGCPQWWWTPLHPLCVLCGSPPQCVVAGDCPRNVALRRQLSLKLKLE